MDLTTRMSNNMAQPGEPRKRNAMNQLSGSDASLVRAFRRIATMCTRIRLPDTIVVKHRRTKEEKERKKERKKEKKKKRKQGKEFGEKKRKKKRKI